MISISLTPQSRAVPPLLISKSISSNHLHARKRNRRFLVFCALILLTLLLGWASSYNSIPTFNSQLAVFHGHRFIIANVEALRTKDHDIVQTGIDVMHKRDKALHCDRSHYRTDVCVARGDVRVVGGGGHGSSRFQVLLLVGDGNERVERVKPYTRKWEESVMRTIDEVEIFRKVMIAPGSRIRAKASVNTTSSQKNVQELVGAGANDRSGHDLDEQNGKDAAASHMRIKHKIRKRPPSRIIRSGGRNYPQLINLPLKRRSQLSSAGSSWQRAEPVPSCEVQHEVPAILFSTGGYTGNVYHEFNDGLIPLFITAQKYGPPAGRVVLIVLEYHSWWMTKYKEVVAQITNYTTVDLSHDTRVHCFPEVTVGLRIHDELSINEQQDHASMEGFQEMLRAAYINSLPVQFERVVAAKQPKLVIVSRRGRSRVLLNQKEVVNLARDVGFAVQVLSPKSSTRMAEIYGVLSGCDAMLGVHGAAMTHLVFMRPGATFIQVVPLGTDWAAATYYGDPARKLGLNYVEYKVSPPESSLWQHYASDDPVLVDPDFVNSKGWAETKRIYLQAQNVTVSLANMAAILRSVYTRAAAPQLQRV